MGISESSTETGYNKYERSLKKKYGTTQVWTGSVPAMTAQTQVISDAQVLNITAGEDLMGVPQVMTRGARFVKDLPKRLYLGRESSARPMHGTWWGLKVGGQSTSPKRGNQTG